MPGQDAASCPHLPKALLLILVWDEIQKALMHARHGESRGSASISTRQLVGAAAGAAAVTGGWSCAAGIGHASDNDISQGTKDCLLYLVSA